MAEYYMQYHNASKLKHYPDDAFNIKTEVETINFDTTPTYKKWVYASKKKNILEAKGNLCFLIVGKKVNAQTKFYLWSLFRIEDFHEKNETHNDIFGIGCNFQKPILLNNSEHFKKFQSDCANFVGFKNITRLAFTQKLISYSSQIPIPETYSPNPSFSLEERSLITQKNEIERKLVQIELLLRNDRQIVNFLKETANYKCQFPNCTAEILMGDGSKYIEVAHINAVKDGGKSVHGNLLVLCPNHHKEFDYGNLKINTHTSSKLSGQLNGKNFEIELIMHHM